MTKNDVISEKLVNTAFSVYWVNTQNPTG